MKHIPVASVESDLALLEKLFGLDHQVLKQQTSGKTGHSDILISDESANWLTFLLSKLLFNPLRARFLSDPGIVASWLQSQISDIQTRKLANVKAFNHLNVLQVKSIEIGNLNPIIDSYQLCYDTESESCLFRIKCSWQDAFSLEVDSSFSLLNLIALPFSVSVRLKNLSFTAQIKTTTTPPKTTAASISGEFCEISCLADDNLLIELEVGSLVGHRTKLKDLPKIKNAIVQVVKKLLLDHLINPKCVKVPFSFDSNLGTNWLLSTSTAIENEEDDTLKGEVKSLSGERDKLDNSAVFADSIISDESERINLFVDSRYDEDDFLGEDLSWKCKSKINCNNLM